MKNKDMKKRILAIILCLVMVAGICGSALAEGLDAGGTVDVETENEENIVESVEEGAVICEICQSESCVCEEELILCEICEMNPCTCEVSDVEALTELDVETESAEEDFPEIDHEAQIQVSDEALHDAEASGIEVPDIEVKDTEQSEVSETDDYNEQLDADLQEEKEEALKNMLELLPEGAEIPEGCTEVYSYMDPDGRYEVNVCAPEGAFPEGVELLATLLEENSEAYIETAKIASENSSFNGMVAMDVRFELEGEEVEPNVSVYVQMNIKGLLPKDVIEDSIAVVHIKEEENQLTPEIVADDASGAVETETIKKVVDVNTAFVLDSFSTIATTYSTGSSTNKLVTDIANVNAKVQLFNYTNSVNSDSNRIRYNYLYNGYSITSGKFGFESGVSAKDNTIGNTIYDVSDSAGTDLKGTYDPTYISSTGVSFSPKANLGGDGYPEVEGTVVPGHEGIAEMDFGQYDSMAYLFSENYAASDLMENGGGLFQLTSDGYYEYNSAKNSAYYNEDEGKFLVYEIPISPHYIDDFDTTIKTDNINNARQYGNFLPFNDPTKIGTSYNEAMTVDGETIKYYQLLPEWSGSEWLNIPDMWFGMTVEFDFYMPEDGIWNDNDMIFQFAGDDDVLVYIDDVLVLDISGIHAPEPAYVNFATGEIEDEYTKYVSGSSTTLKQRFIDAGYTTAQINELFDGDTFKDYSAHTLKFFYLERGSTISHCHLKFNMPTLPDGELTVEKKLENATDEEKLEKEFTFQIEVGNTTKNQVHYTDNNGNTGYIALTNGTGTFKLKHGESYTFDDLALYETYKVSEASSVGYTSQWVGATSGTIVNSKPIYLVCTNTMQKSSLKVEKDIVNDSNAADKTFTFSINLKDTDNKALSKVTYTTEDGTNGVLNLTDGTGTFTLGDGDYYIFDLTVGDKYIITEVDSNKNYYTTTWEGATSGTISSTAQVTVKCINTLQNGSLKVIKEVLNESTPSGNEFQFTISLKDSKNVALSTVNYITHDGTSGTLSLTNGTGSFALSDDEYYVFALPVGTQYEVTEAAVNGYVTTWDGSVAGSVTDTSLVELKCINTYRVDLYELPSTGGPGIYLYLIAGVVLLMGGSTIIYKKRCKEVLRRR